MQKSQWHGFEWQTRTPDQLREQKNSMAHNECGNMNNQRCDNTDHRLNSARINSSLPNIPNLSSHMEVRNKTEWFAQALASWNIKLANIPAWEFKNFLAWEFAKAWLKPNDIPRQALGNTWDTQKFVTNLVNAFNRNQKHLAHIS